MVKSWLESSRAYHAAVLVTFALSGMTWGRPDPSHILLAIVVVWGMLSKHVPVQRAKAITPIYKSFGLFLIFFALSLALNGWASSRQLLFTANLLANMTLAGFLAAYVRGEEHLRRVTGAYVACAVFLSILAVPSSIGYLHWEPLRPTPDARTMPFAGDPNVFGSFLVPAYLFVVERYVRSASRDGRVWFGTATVIAIGLLLAASRGAWVNMAVVGAIYLAVRPRRSTLKGLLAPLTLAFVFVHGLAFIFVHGALLGVPEANGALLSVPEARIRLFWYDADRFAATLRAVGVIARRPLGVGPGEGPEVIGYGTHNFLLQVAMENGIGALAAFAAAIGRVVWTCLTRPHEGAEHPVPSRLVIGASLIGLMVNGLFIDILYWRILWLLIGLGWAMAILQRERGQGWQLQTER